MTSLSKNTNSLKKMKSETLDLESNNDQLKKFSLDKIEEESNTNPTTLYRSLSLNLPQNFVPHIKPKKSNILPPAFMLILGKMNCYILILEKKKLFILLLVLFLKKIIII